MHLKNNPETRKNKFIAVPVIHVFSLNCKLIGSQDGLINPSFSADWIEYAEYFSNYALSSYGSEHPAV